MPCSRTQHGDACGVRTQDLKIRSPTLYHYATALPMNTFELYSIQTFSRSPRTFLSTAVKKCIFVFLVFYAFVFNIYHILLTAFFVLENLEAHAACRNIIVLWKGDVPIITG